MSWLLINPTNHFLKMFPLGIAYVSAALKAGGIPVKTLNLEFIPEQDMPGAVTAAIADKDISVVGLGGLYFEFERIKNIVQWVRQARPDIKVVVGNGVVACDPKIMLPALGAHIGVVGEGEETVVELARALADGTPLQDVAGLAILDEEKGLATLTGTRQAIKDIDAIALPDYQAFDVERYLDSQNVVTYYGYSYSNSPRPLPMLASRSCPFKCTFCYHSIATYRKRKLDSFFAEVEMMVSKYNINSLLIYDDLFAVKASRLEQFCSRMEQFNLNWQVSMRVQSIDEDKINARLLKRMKEAGCVSINLGLESVNETILESMVKKISKTQIATALRLVTEADLTMQGNFIFGDTAETAETANDTLNWWAKHNEYTIQTDPIWVFPGTALFNRAVADKRIVSTKEYLALPNPVINVSKVDDDTFDGLVNTLGTIQAYLNRFPGELKSIEHGILHDGVQGYDFTVRCPHCGDDQTYLNHGCWKRLMCRTCGGLFDVPIKRYMGWNQYSDDSRMFTAKATEAYYRGDYGDAYIEARSALFDHPCNKDANFITGTIALKAGFLSTAFRFLSEAMSQESDQGHIYNNYAVCLFGRGEIELALLLFRHAQRLEHTIDEAVDNEAAALQALGGNDGNLSFIHKMDRPQRDIGGLSICHPPTTLDSSTVPAKTPLRPRYAAMKKATPLQPTGTA